MTDYRADEGFARELDAADPLRAFRDRFHIPTARGGGPVIYLCGNSLGLQPKDARRCIEQELTDWADLAVEAHFDGRSPWYCYHEQFTESGARLVGAIPGEVVMMNSLTVNLHLMMITFYRPTPRRYKILIDAPTFPSDTYAVKSQIRYHGREPDDALIIAGPRAGAHTLRTEDIAEILDRDGEHIALVLFSGVNFFTGQVMDMPVLTALAHRYGCAVGFDLAHAAGNVPLHLHNWNVDFAVWCSYKYLNAGPGAVAGCFVHDRHGRNVDLPRLAGWWGNDPTERFKMHLLPEFHPQLGAAGWQVSNPPIMALAPLRASLDIFDEAGMPALREKSERLTGYLQFLIDQHSRDRFEVITPRAPAERGCQLSILDRQSPRDFSRQLKARGVIADFREPNVIRVAPTPLYNSFHDVWNFSRILQEIR